MQFLYRLGKVSNEHDHSFRQQVVFITVLCHTMTTDHRKQKEQKLTAGLSLQIYQKIFPTYCTLLMLFLFLLLPVLWEMLHHWHLSSELTPTIIRQTLMMGALNTTTARTIPPHSAINHNSDYSQPLFTWFSFIKVLLQNCEWVFWSNGWCTSF